MGYKQLKAEFENELRMKHCGVFAVDRFLFVCFSFVNNRQQHVDVDEL